MLTTVFQIMLSVVRKHQKERNKKVAKLLKKARKK